MTTLGKYELHEQIGRGGFGTVYRATDTSLGRTVALKVLHPQMAVDVDFVERFQKEARLAAQLENPHVVTIYGVGEDQGRYFIAMRYYPGGSLSDALKDGPLPWNQCVKFLGQVCEGLQQLHQQGWVHRDMKPSNILFDPQGRAVVADFGLARVLTSSTSSSGGIAGTPHYKAPELWRGKPPASPATDVYALGCILGEILSGHALFPGETPDEVMTKHVLDGPEFGAAWPPPDLPEGAADFIQRCLSKNPADRPADAAAFERELREITTNIALPTKEAPAAFHSEVTASLPAVDLSPAQAATQRQSAPPSDTPIHTPLPTVQSQPSAATLHPPLKKDQPGPTKSRLPGRIGPVLAMLSIVLVVGIFLLIRALPNNPPEEGAPPAASAAPTRAALIQPSQAPAAASPTETAAALVNCTQAGLTRSSNKDGMTQVCVPAGEFQMGSDKNVDSQAEDSELPQHNVFLDAYWIDQTEVTNANYSKFLTSQVSKLNIEGNVVKLEDKIIYQLVCDNCENWTDRINWDGSDFIQVGEYSKHPVSLVTWDGAHAYCQWANRRLPTEAEWEKAARGTDGRIYPWGNQFDGSKLNFCDKTCPYDWKDGNNNDGFADTSPVGQYPTGASPYGALDMAGNVWEWVADRFGNYTSERITNPTGPQFGDDYTLRGGSWDWFSDFSRAAYRGMLDRINRFPFIGFRCAQSAHTP